MTPLITIGISRFYTLSTTTANCRAFGSSNAACDTGLPDVGGGNVTNTEVQQVLVIVFGVIAALAVLMIVISGFRFIIAQGNPQETVKARNTIIYALIGLVVSLFAEAIVATVLGKV